VRLLSLLGFVLLSPLLTACRDAQETSALYFGQSPPGDTPAVFAPTVISREDRFEQFLLYAPDGRELTFGVTNSDWSAFSLYHMRVNTEDGRWTDPVPAPFLGSDSSALTACLSFDMGTAFLTSARPSYPPADIWMSVRGDTGWSEPTKLGPPISSDADEFEVAVSRNGTLYFSSSREGGLGDLDIYRARLVDGGYPTAENLGPPINTSWGDDLPYVAPDESYLIFASDRPGGLGNRDLYISFQVDGSWTEARNLSRPINSEYWDIYPSVSPDGKYLFFTRRTAWQASDDSDIYWVSARFIERLRETLPNDEVERR
jgi:hypothetical protein